MCATCSSDFCPEIPDENYSSKFEPKITDNSSISTRLSRSEASAPIRTSLCATSPSVREVHGRVSTPTPHKVPFHSSLPVPIPDISCEKSRGIRSAARWRTRTQTWRTRCRGLTSTPPSLSLRGELHQLRLPRTTQVGALFRILLHDTSFL